ncbi:Nucleoside-diphosphate-sugar epimerase [Rhizobiales bacterium GAS191]|nr:Nucleoside-diphosphate-sugar epimerase [Rhizobiales bacterium GAS191]
MRAAVTGGAGRLGRKVVADLLGAGWNVVSLDKAKPAADQGCPFVSVDFSDFGQTVGALTGVDNRHGGVDAVVHLAAIPGPGHLPNPTLFANNIQSTYNVFAAARLASIRNVVFASSEAVHGAPFSSLPPLPIDEDSPLQSTTTYGMVKFLEEQMAQQFARWEPTMKLIALRLAWVAHQEYYEAFASFDVPRHAASLWNYIDARDAAQAVRLALEYGKTGFEAFVISSDDTVMPQDSRELLRIAYPDARLRQEIVGRQALFISKKAKRVLGFRPRFSWRQ